MVAIGDAHGIVLSQVVPVAFGVATEHRGGSTFDIDVLGDSVDRYVGRIDVEHVRREPVGGGAPLRAPLRQVGQVHRIEDIQRPGDGCPVQVLQRHIVTE